MSNWEDMVAADVLTLGMNADTARRRRPDGHVVSYLRVHTVNARTLESSPVAEAPESAQEVRLYETPADLDAAIAHVQAMRRVAGARRVAAFSMADLESRGWSDLDRALAALVEAGLDDVAALPVDACVDLAASVACLRRAGLEPRRVTVARPLTPERKLDVLRIAQQLAAGDAPFARFSPLPRVAPVDTPTTGYDDVRMVALSRLALPPMVSIEVDWTLYGPKLAQVALTFGADHLDAVQAVDEDPSLGRRRGSLEEVTRNIRAAGFEPRQASAECSH